jgi:hypothetical protein
MQKQASSSTIQYNGQVGTQHQNITETHKAYNCPILIKPKKEEGSIGIGTDYKHHRMACLFNVHLSTLTGDLLYTWHCKL